MATSAHQSLFETSRYAAVALRAGGAGRSGLRGRAGRGAGFAPRHDRTRDRLSRRERDGRDTATGAHGQLLRALDRRGGGAWTAATSSASPWSCGVYPGTSHRILGTLRPDGTDFLDGLEDAEFALNGHVVIGVNAEDRGGGMWRIDVLTIEAE